MLVCGGFETLYFLDSLPSYDSPVNRYCFLVPNREPQVICISDGLGEDSVLDCLFAAGSWKADKTKEGKTILSLEGRGTSWPEEHDWVPESLLHHQRFLEKHSEWANQFALELLRDNHPHNRPPEDSYYGFGYSSLQTQMTLLCLPRLLAVSVGLQIRALYDGWSQPERDIRLGEMKAIRGELVWYGFRILLLLAIVAMLLAYFGFRG